jgi:pimeloyl-ACP methyl ester carboxylesterase
MDHVADLASLIDHLELGPAHVAGTSWGGSIVLRLAVERADLVRTLAAHEPPAFDLLASDPAHLAQLAALRSGLEAVIAALDEGDLEAGARLFVEGVALGPGAWDGLTAEERRDYVANAPAYLAQSRDPGRMAIDLRALETIRCPVLLSGGDRRDPLFATIVDRLGEAIPGAEQRLLPGTAHAPQLTHPHLYAEALTEFAARPALRG